MNLKHWARPQPSGKLAGILAKEYGIPLFLAEIFQSRGLDSPAKAEAFFCPDLPLSDPFLFPDMERAVSTIKQAVSSGKTIAVYGDYDCDGICSSVILLRCLRQMGADALLYIPSREEDGYGLNCAALERLWDQDVALIVTVDNGISALAEAEYAARLGLELVITDHHQPGSDLPCAAAVVDPHRRDTVLPFRAYCGAGVAFQLARALLGDVALSELDELLVLAAVATVGDAVPLTGENRSLVRKGLKKLRKSGNPGLDALIRVSGIKTVTARSVAFGLVPRINAAGRMGNASLAAELFLCGSREEADRIAQELDHLNARRQKTEKKILEEALEKLDENPALLRRRVLVLAGEGWDAGVIGIVSARLLERFGKPVFLLSVNGDQATGSARSVEGFSVFKALQACAGALIRYGGHSQAGGLTLETGKIPAFSKAVSEYADGLETFPVETCRIDRMLKPEEATLEHAECLRRLEPFGTENPEPVFLMEGMRIETIQPLSGGKHTKLLLEKGGKRAEVLCFGCETAVFPYPAGFEADLLVSLEVSEFAGRRSPSLRMKEIRPAGLDEMELIQERHLAERLCENTAEPDEAKCSLSREEMIPVYRLLKRLSVYRGDLETLYFTAFCHKINYIQFRMALEVLRELELLDYSEVRRIVTVRENPPAVSLTASRLFRSLQRRGREQETEE